LRPSLRDPELRRRRRDGQARWGPDRRRTYCLDDGRARLLHEARHYPALHHVVPRADNAARSGQACWCDARAPRRLAGRLPDRDRAARPRTAARLRAFGARQSGLLGQFVHGLARAGAGMSRISVDDARALWQAPDEELIARANEVRDRYHEPKRATYM